MKEVIEITIGSVRLPSLYTRNKVTGLFGMHGNPAASLPDGITQEQLAEEYTENLHWLSFYGEGCDLAYNSNGKWTVVEVLPSGGLHIHGSPAKGKSIIPDLAKKAGLVEVEKGVYVNPNDPRCQKILHSLKTTSTRERMRQWLRKIGVLPEPAKKTG